MIAHGRSPVMASKHTPGCLCGAKGVRSDRFDAYFCPSSGNWLEGECKDPHCIFCHSGRPRTAHAEPEYHAPSLPSSA